ncbi:hypothetical protein PsYK624_064780 [Phanerochaete sordida]|uniref:Uncharacterized protein n=1 Tax=Phanerochaete sordida TaxID=48140 RepID=A0A9P3G950_9APHY|nr:hypothetical protein PsYK624_064780 [Phanerochaete sordida]
MQDELESSPGPEQPWRPQPLNARNLRRSSRISALCRTKGPKRRKWALIYGHAYSAQEEGMQDESESPSELELRWNPQPLAGPSQPKPPSGRFPLEKQTQKRACDAQDIPSRDVPTSPAAPASESAGSAPRPKIIQAPIRSPKASCAAERSMPGQNIQRPRQDSPEERALSAVTRPEVMAAPQPRMEGRAVPPLHPDAGGVVPAAPRPQSSVSSDAPVMQREQAGDAGERAVRDFLHSLLQPLDGLLPVFLQAGIRDEACLKGLAGLSQEQKLQLLRVDLGLNILQSRMILDSLSRIS